MSSFPELNEAVKAGVIKRVVVDGLHNVKYSHGQLRGFELSINDSRRSERKPVVRWTERARDYRESKRRRSFQSSERKHRER